MTQEATARVLPTPTWEVRSGACLPHLEDMDPATVDAVVTDPPYALSIEKGWDTKFPDPRAWKEALRVTKPGGFALVFCAARTAHRLWCQVEDGGWKIRDQLLWMYSTGQMKSLTQLRPAYEPIAICQRQPDLSRDENMAKFNTGVLRFHDRQVADDGTVEEPTLLGDRGERKGIPCDIAVDEVTADEMGDKISRYFFCGKPRAEEKDLGLEHFEQKMRWSATGIGGFGKTARLNTHTTVKPVALMRWLIRLVSAPGALIIDPFCGSGSTGVAAILEGRRFLGFEREADYAEIARARCTAAETVRRTTPTQLELI